MSTEAREQDSGTAEARASSRWGVLRHAHFRNVWGAAFVSSMGGWMEIVGVQWAMAQATLADGWVGAGKPGAPIMMGYLAVAQMAPTLLLGLYGGVLADTLNRKKLLLVSQWVMMLIAALLALASWRGQLTPGVLLVLGAAHGVAMAFSIPAWQVLTPRLVPRAELTSAITLNGLQFNLARALGPALAGLAMAQYGATVLFVINTLSFVAIILAVSFTPDAPAPPRTGESPWAQIREAFVYVLGHRGPLVLIIAITVYSMLATPLLRVLPIIVQEVYGEAADAYGKLLGAMGVGAVIGALTIRRVPGWYPKHHFIPLAITLCGLSLVGCAIAANFWQALVALVVCGIFWMWAFNAAFAALQLLLEDRLRGRVMAICNTISFGAMALGAMLAGGVGEVVATLTARPGEVLNEGVGAVAGLGVVAVLLVVYGLCIMTWRTPEIDGLRPGDGGYDRKPGLLRGITARAHRAE